MAAAESHTAVTDPVDGAPATEQWIALCAAVRSFDDAKAKHEAACMEWKNNVDPEMGHKLEALKNDAKDVMGLAKDVMDKAHEAYMDARAKRPAPDDEKETSKRARMGPRTADNDLINFWSACRDQMVSVKQILATSKTVNEEEEEGEEEEEEGVEQTFNYFSMPENVALLGLVEMYGTVLLIRPHYPSLFEEWMAAVDIYRKDCLMGTPGTGKSFFLLYALCRLGMGCYEHPIVFQNTDGKRLFFHGVEVLKGGGDDFESYLDDPQCMYLVDGAANSLPSKDVRARTFLAASPNKEVYGAFQKATKSTPIIAPVCTLHELLAMRNIDAGIRNSLNEVDVKRTFLVTGGSARAMSYWAKHRQNTPESQVDLAVGKCDLATCRYAAQHAIASEKSVAHSLFHIFPLPGNPRAYELRFASPYAERVFTDSYIKQCEGELVEFLASSESLPGFPTLRGVLFEGYAIKRLVAGGDFKCCELKANGGRGEEEIMAVPSAREQLFRWLGDVQEIRNGIHHRPSFGTLETLDSFISSEWLFQVTTAKDHDVKIKGLQDVLRHLEAQNDPTAASTKARLFIVVPENVYHDHFQQRQALVIQRGAVAKKPSDVDLVKQYVLCLPY